MRTRDVSWLPVAALLLLTAAPAAAAEGEPDIFSGGIGNAVITLIIFLGVVIILGKYAWPPLVRVLAEREETIRRSLEDAKREREDAEKLLAQYRQQIDKAREEATAIVEEGKRDAVAVARRIQEEARKEGEGMIARAKREIGLARDTAVKDLYDQTAELAIKVAGQVVGKTLSEAEHRALVNESLERMKSAEKPELN